MLKELVVNFSSSMTAWCSCQRESLKLLVVIGWSEHLLIDQLSSLLSMMGEGMRLLVLECARA